MIDWVFGFVNGIVVALIITLIIAKVTGVSVTEKVLNTCQIQGMYQVDEHTMLLCKVVRG